MEIVIGLIWSAILWGGLTVVVAKSNGQPRSWGLYGVLFGPIGLVFVGLKGRRAGQLPAGTVRTPCPACSFRNIVPKEVDQYQCAQCRATLALQH